MTTEAAPRVVLRRSLKICADSWCDAGGVAKTRATRGERESIRRNQEEDMATIALFFGTTSVVLFNKRTIFFSSQEINISISINQISTKRIGVGRREKQEIGHKGGGNKIKEKRERQIK